MSRQFPCRHAVRAGACQPSMNPDVQWVVSAGLQGGGVEPEPGCGLLDLLRRLQDVDAVLGPQLAGGRAAQPGVGLTPDRHVAADKLLRVDIGHGPSNGHCALEPPSGLGPRCCGPAIPAREPPTVAAQMAISSAVLTCSRPVSPPSARRGRKASASTAAAKAMPAHSHSMTSTACTNAVRTISRSASEPALCATATPLATLVRTASASWPGSTARSSPAR